MPNFMHVSLNARFLLKIDLICLAKSPIRMRQNTLRCANFTRGKQMAHGNANIHMGK